MDEKCGGKAVESKDDEPKSPDKVNQKPPEPPKDYIHVRARRGQATDSHSLAERVSIFFLLTSINGEIDFASNFAHFLILFRSVARRSANE